MRRIAPVLRAPPARRPARGGGLLTSRSVAVETPAGMTMPPATLAYGTRTVEHHMAQQTRQDRLEVHHAPARPEQAASLPGEDAEKPTDIPAAGWKQIVKRAWAETKDDN